MVLKQIWIQYIFKTIAWDKMAYLQNITTVVYFDQILGAARTWKLVKTLFKPFQPFLLILIDFRLEITEKVWKLTKKVVPTIAL